MSLQLYPRSTNNECDGPQEYYVPTSDEEEEGSEEDEKEEEEEEAEKGKGESCSSSDCMAAPPPVPPRSPTNAAFDDIGEECGNTPPKGGEVRFQVNWEVHNYLQNLVTHQEDSEIEEEKAPPGSVVSVNWDTHLMLQRLEQKESELPSVAEHMPDLSSENPYQPLIPPRGVIQNANTQTSEYQPLIFK